VQGRLSFEKEKGRGHRAMLIGWVCGFFPDSVSVISHNTQGT